uniref:SCP domain-containing protein n=1 Tax=Strongyloides papillosus TaxID=174720 RepID=A0A0N5BS53_STREA
MTSGNLYRIAQYSYPDILRLNPFSELIWARVWYGCGFSCFAEHDFKILKEGLFTEINEYRRLHGVPQLVKNTFLQKLAASRAKKLAAGDPVQIKNYPFLGILDAIERLQLGNLAIKNLYDRFMSRYKWHGKNRISNYVRYSQIIWKKTKEVGIGAHTKGHIIYVSFFFSPKGGFGNFKKNVFPVQEKHLYIHNLFKRNHNL